MLSITAEDILPQRVNRSRAIWLFVSVFAVTLFALHQIYSHSGTPVFDIWATNAVISNLAVANGPPSMHLHSEHQLAFESQESSLHQLGNTSAGVPPMEKTEENLKFGLTIGTVEQYQPALEKKQVLPESERERERERERDRQTDRQRGGEVRERAQKNSEFSPIEKE